MTSVNSGAFILTFKRGNRDNGVNLNAKRLQTVRAVIVLRKCIDVLVMVRVVV